MSANFGLGHLLNLLQLRAEIQEDGLSLDELIQEGTPTSKFWLGKWMGEWARESGEVENTSVISNDSLEQINESSEQNRYGGTPLLLPAATPEATLAGVTSQVRWW